MDTPKERHVDAELVDDLHLVSDRLTRHLRATLQDLAEPARKRHGDAVAEHMLAWAGEANIEAMAEWLDTKGWAWMDEHPEHADKVEEALVQAWNAERNGGETVHFRGEKIAAIAYFGKKRKDRKPEVEDLLPPDTPPELHDALVQLLRDTLGDPLEVILGLDALRAMMASRYWIPLLHAAPAGTPCTWIRLLAIPWATERASNLAERLQRQSAAAELDAAPRVKVKGRDFRRLPKVVGGLSWALGGPGVELARVKMDGREYAPAPDLAVLNPSALVPAAYALLPEDHAKKPHQTLLPIDLQGGEDAPPLPVALAGATQYAIAPAAGKLGLLVMAAAHAGGGKLHKTTLRELTQAINPGAAKLVTSHYGTVMRGLAQLDGLRLVLPNGLSYRVYECPVPWRELRPEEYDAPLYVGMTRTFEKTLDAIAEHAGKSYRGDFLFDLTGAMLLPTRRPGLLRQYIRACAHWNYYWKPGTFGEPDPSRVPEVSVERWAAMTNYLPPAAVEYLRADGKGDRRSLSHGINDTLEDTEALGAAGLVMIAKANRKIIRLLPPPEYMEAWAESRKGAHKMPGNNEKP